MAMVRIQWIGSLLIGLCLLLQGCVVGSSDLQYHLALETDPSDQKPDCTLVLKPVVDETLKGSSGPLGSSSWTIRNFQIALERQLHQTVKVLACSSDKTAPLSKGSVKWLAAYAYETTDPDQELRRFEEFLNSRKLARELIRRVPVVADERAEEVEGLIISEGRCDRRSQWLGNPETSDEHRCSTKSRPLNKTLSYTNQKNATRYQDGDKNDLIERLLLRVKEVRSERMRNIRFFVLGYEIPWDEDNTLIRYGIRFYFIDTLDLEKSVKDEPAITTEYLGYELDYANEATPQPILAHSMKSGVPGKAKEAYEREITDAKTAAPQLSNTRRILYWTGYPFAVAIGVKNAAFELAKIPFSTVAGLLFGRDNPLYYPAQNIRTAWNALEVEIGHQPSYYFFPGIINLLGEVPFVGQIFHFNTGPKRMDWDFAPEPDRIREKIFLSRGIYGGDKRDRIQDCGRHGPEWSTRTTIFIALPTATERLPTSCGRCSISRMGRGITRRPTSCVTQGRPIGCTSPVTAAACNGAQAPHESSPTMATPCRKCLAWPAPMSVRPTWINAFRTPFIFS